MHCHLRYCHLPSCEPLFFDRCKNLSLSRPPRFLKLPFNQNPRDLRCVGWAESHQRFRWGHSFVLSMEIVCSSVGNEYEVMCNTCDCLLRGFRNPMSEPCIHACKKSRNKELNLLLTNTRLVHVTSTYYHRWYSMFEFTFNATYFHRVNDI